METWKCLHIHYHAPDKDGLFLEGVLPAVERLLRQGTLTRWFCQRHWLHGPHLRVHAGLASTDAWEVVRGELESQANGYLASHPSTASLNEEEYLRRYGPIAVLEQSGEHPLPLYPDSSLHWKESLLPEQPYGGAEGARIARDFLADTQAVLTEVIRQTPDRMAERLFMLARLMLAYCASFEAPAVAALSFRSHAEAYFHGVPNGAVLRQRFEASFAQQAESLGRALEEAEQGLVSPVIAGWMAAVRRGYERTVEAARQGTLRLPGREDYEALEARLPEGLSPEMAASATFEPSPYHTALRDKDDPYARLLETPEFQGRRLLVNLVYNKLLLAGIRPLERLFLCSIVAQTAERRHGDWKETAQALVRGGAQ